MPKTSLRIKPSDPSQEKLDREEHFNEFSGRNEELVGKKDIHDACLELYADIERGFSDQWERSNQQMDYWDLYNCELGSKQFYSGNSKVFLPFVRDAIKARKTRFCNQIFPPSGKNVEVITSENKPEALMALLEFYIRKTRMRSAIVPALLKNGDVEGQYNLYMSWRETERHVTWHVKRTAELPDDPDIKPPEDDDDFTFWDIEEDTITHGAPDIEILADADVLVLPQTSRNIDEALEDGGSATIIRRWTKAKIEQMIKDGELEEDKGKALMEHFSQKDSAGTPNKGDHITDAAGIKKEGNKHFALVYETWTKLALKDEETGDTKRRICRVRYGSDRLVLSCRRNPYWCDKVPLISTPADRVEGSFKGRSEVKSVDTIQYAANDFINEGLDSATYAMLPITLTDPAKNPRVGTMQLSVAAVWETSPNDTSFASFPNLYDRALEVTGSLRAQIFQTLSVNPAMIPSSTTGGKGKTNQAQVAQEQQVDILTTADVVTGLEGDVLSDILRWFIYLDHQFRQHDLTIRQFGAVGKQMNMEVIPPVQMDRRWEARWFGVEAARSAQQMQLQMAGLNMIKAIPPQMYEGFSLNMAPVLQTFMENLFGPRVAAEVFQDMKKKLSLQVDTENNMLLQGFDLVTHPVDNDQEHIQSHMQAMQQNGGEHGDQQGAFRVHIQRHQMQLQKKNAMQAMQAMQGMPQQGGQQQGQGRGGGRQGAVPAGPRGGQNPAGAIHQDRMRDPGMMPRPRPGGI